VLENSEFYLQLKEAVVFGDAKALEALSAALDITVMETGTFPEDRFESILTILQDKLFLGLKGS